MVQVSIESLAGRLKKRVDDLEKTINRENKRIVVETHYVFAEGVPVDTGEARSNTRGTSAAAVPTNVIPAYAPGSKLGRSETGNLTAANAQCARAARAWRASTGKPFVIYNNWSQIERLNNGEISRQGSHFVEAAQAFLVKELKKVKWIK